MVGSIPVDDRPCCASYTRSDILAKASGSVTALWERTRRAVTDRFHVAKKFNEAIDTLRKN
jgi:hypothetical protein